MQKWLKGETVGKLFISIAEQFIANDCSSEHANIFESALTGNNEGIILFIYSLILPYFKYPVFTIKYSIFKLILKFVFQVYS